MLRDRLCGLRGLPLSACGTAVLHFLSVSIFRVQRGKWTQKITQYHAAAGKKHLIRILNHATA
jgi:hypothetical protein